MGTDKPPDPKAMALAQAAIDAKDFMTAGAVLAADALGMDMNDPKVDSVIGEMRSRRALDHELSRLGEWKEKPQKKK